MRGTAGTANQYRVRWELAAHRFPLANTQRSGHHAIGPAFVIDEATWSEFGQGEEAWALEIGTAASVGAARNKGSERQSLEVVARHEAFGSQVAIGIKVTGQALLAPLQQGKLIHGLPMQNACSITFAFGQAVRIHGAT